MTTPQDPRRHPLQDDEIELARVLRALPTGEPSSKLDAAILGAAADAVAASPPLRPRRRVKVERWLPTWAIGTAAAAVLAIGVGTQLVPPLAPSEDRAAPAAQSAPRATEEDRLDVELIEREREYPPTYPPPDAAKATARPGAAQPVPPPPPPPPVVAAPEPEAAPALPQATFAEPAVEEGGAFAPPPATELDSISVTGSRLARDAPAPTDRLRQSPSEINRADAERRAQARQLEQLRDARAEADSAGFAADPGALGRVSAPPPAAPAAAPAENAARAADSADVGETAATRERAEAQAGAGQDDAGPTAYGPVLPQQALPPLSADTVLEPADWIERIRDRWRSGDRDGALASLRLLREHHPDLAIPADLQALR